MTTALLKKSVLAAGVAVMLAAAAPAMAAADTYGYIDVDKVVHTAEAPKALMTELEAKRKSFMEQAMKEEAELRKADQDLAKQKDKLSKEDFEKKVKEFQTKLSTAQEQVQKRKAGLEQTFSNAMSKMRQEIFKAAADIAKSKGYTGVFKSEAFILSDDDRNITDEVITSMNKNVKKISIK